jgi:hypothetical protein
MRFVCCGRCPRRAETGLMLVGVPPLKAAIVCATQQALYAVTG